MRVQAVATENTDLATSDIIAALGGIYLLLAGREDTWPRRLVRFGTVGAVALLSFSGFLLFEWTQAADPLAFMKALRAVIRGCPEPWTHAEGGHFLQEWGDEVARAALAHWGEA